MVIIIKKNPVSRIEMKAFVCVSKIPCLWFRSNSVTRKTRPRRTSSSTSESSAPMNMTIMMILQIPVTAGVERRNHPKRTVTANETETESDHLPLETKRNADVVDPEVAVEAMMIMRKIVITDDETLLDRIVVAVAVDR